MSFSKLDPLQTLREAFDDNKGGFKYTAVDAAIGVSWDYVSVTYPSSTQEVYTFKTGGSGGTTVRTVTVNYTTTDKTFISNVSTS